MANSYKERQYSSLFREKKEEKPIYNTVEREETKVERTLEEKPVKEVVEKKAEKPAFVTKIASVNVRIRRQPGGEIIGVLNKGGTVHIVSEENGWSKTESGNYIMSKFLA